MAELSHRVKNTLATVISIAQQSFARNPDVDEARRSFDSPDPRACPDPQPSRGSELVRRFFRSDAPRRAGAVFREDRGNVRVSGPPVRFNAKGGALTLGMALHELATNAAKHGALSSKRGSVDVAWQVDPRDRRLRIRWTEAGGPTVTLPARSGFGRLLLERALASDLGGDVQLHFDQDGLKCAIAIPLDEHVVRLS